jgi:hypothetical protein
VAACSKSPPADLPCFPAKGSREAGKHFTAGKGRTANIRSDLLNVMQRDTVVTLRWQKCCQPCLSARDKPVIKIRYAHLPEGLHAWVASKGRHTIIYLRPTLGPGERRDALLRVLRNGRRGYGPRLPAAGLARAVAADRAARTVRNAAAAAHCHPVGTLGMAGLLATALACYLALTGPGQLAGMPQARTAPPLSATGGAAGGGPASGTMLPVIRQPLGSRLASWRGPVPRLPARGTSRGGVLAPQRQPSSERSGLRRPIPRRPGHWRDHGWPWHPPRQHDPWAHQRRPGRHSIREPRPEPGLQPRHDHGRGGRHSFAPHPRPGAPAGRHYGPGRGSRGHGPGREGRHPAGPWLRHR